jgi:hypothetical protein
LWTLVLASLFILVVFVVLWAFVDNFRRRDHSGLAKALWFIFILFLPLFGVFCYLIARPAVVEYWRLDGIASMTLSAKPNVVFILADNLGWGDLSSCAHSPWQQPGEGFTSAARVELSAEPVDLREGRFEPVA